MRMKITQHKNTGCTLEFGEAGMRTVWTFYASENGGYVYRACHSGDIPACLGLTTAGITLYWNGDKPLADLIRKEYKKFK